MQNDSRKVKAGDLFVAYPGAVSDGRQFLSQAVALGAVAIVYEPKRLPTSMVLPSQVPCIPIPDLAKQLAALAARFYVDPSASQWVTGVTGTNGKTTIAYQLAQAHQLLGRKAAYIGTIGQGQISHLQPQINTTPDALCLQSLLADYRNQHIQNVCMEVSSHALVKHRVDHIAFREAIYTNLSHEHLDYHQTMHNYAKAKAALFSKSTLQWVLLNQDDAYVSQMAGVVPPSVQAITYGIEQQADIRAYDCRLFIHGSEFTVASPWGTQTVSIPSLGAFNIYNSLAVYGSLLAHGYPLTNVVSVMAQLRSSLGRMEIVAQDPCVIVDYAHTPAALENVLKTLLRLKADRSSNIWVVFGCGGDRDKTKRPLMGKVVSEQAEKVILTSDNPRHEDPDAIIQDIIVGIPTNADVTTIVDRREAIQYALQAANKNDIVLIAGKGHEDYQIIGDTRYAFSDQAEVRKYIGA
jgi:UDP-N-acetylmuramoyl-L-alanyl-D-glutamate--2,6-diaminopimelate ligase